MTYNHEKHHRRSVRIDGYDYSSPGAYFVTICAWNRECVFGETLDGEIKLNDYGKVIQQEWLCTGDIRPNIEMDEYVVMPNHFHGIVIINYRMDTLRMGTLRRGVLQYAPTERQFAKPIADSLPTITLYLTLYSRMVTLEKTETDKKRIVPHVDYNKILLKIPV